MAETVCETDRGIALAASVIPSAITTVVAPLSVDSRKLILMTTFEWFMACAGIATAIGTLGLAGFAFTAFRTSVAQLRLLASDSTRQTRPYVNIDLAPGLHGNGFWDITIENVGRSIARNLRIDAGSLAARDADDHISEHLSAFLSRSQTLPPGARRRVMWRMEADTGRTVAGADADVKVTATYNDDQGTAYSDQFDVATEGYGHVAPSPTDGCKVSGSGLTKNEASLANIDRALRALNTHVGMLRS